MSLPALAKSPDNVTLAERVNVLIRAYNQTLRIAQELVSETGAVATGTTQIPIDDTIPQNTEGTEFMSLAITPVSATNKLKIDIVAFYCFTAQQWSVVGLFQDSNANAIAAFAPYQGTSTASFPCAFTHYMTAGGTVATTFKVRIGGQGGGTITFNGQNSARFLGGVMASSITITEIIP